MIYKVNIEAPAINEEVVLAADDAETAKDQAVLSALNRQRERATVTVEQVPEVT